MEKLALRTGDCHTLQVSATVEAIGTVGDTGCLEL